MIRLIKFRAKATANQKWNNIKVGDFVFGSFIQSGVDAPCIIFGDGEQIEIDVRTIGQFTGQKDVTGSDIYEGDIAEHVSIGNTYVYFDKLSRFMIKFEKGNGSEFLNGNYVKVNGTIHDVGGK